ncbi:MAG TPA: RNA polymerase sigma factor [Candidatus Cloacimonetes bacterium]|nr:RNA polymerase sigma factor [Candidatus Cloacimonadota bacterium]
MDKEHFEEFLRAHEKRIYRYLLGIAKNEQDAMDLVQLTFISVYEKFETIREKTALAYVYRVAHNKAMTFLRQKSRYVDIDPTVMAQITKAPQEEEKADYSQLHEEIANLSPRLASVIHLQYYEKMSYKEMAESLGISVKAVESLLVRAKRILRKKVLQEKN